MKLSEGLTPKVQVERPILKDMHLVHRDGPSVRVRRFVIEDDRGIRYAAELYAQEAGIERAVIDAASNEELLAMIEPAAHAFALSVRLRSRSARSRP